ncbi:MAG: S41 family peptidase [Casimicrobiaceae bacterium]
MNNQAYLRHPNLLDDKIVFVTDDDLWQVSASGGIARRLTAGLSEPSTPCLSPDGRWIAFVSRDEQHAEVYLMPSDGGLARRMTWLGPDTMVRGWTPEGHILFVTTYGQPFFRNYRAYTLDSAGGAPQLLPLGQVNHLALGPGGIKIIGRNTADPARWKRYKGGTAGHLWIDANGSGAFRRMDELAGNVTSPVWLAGRVYYLSDAEGVGNLYSCMPDGSEVRRHSDHDNFYARHVHTDGKRIVYQCGADIWLFDPVTDTTTELDIQILSHRTQAARKFVRAEEHLGSVNIHPAGHSLAVDARGKIFTFALWEGGVRQLGKPDGVRYRHSQWLDDGATVVAIGDGSGEERVAVFEGASSRELPWDIGRVVAMKAASRGRRIAIGNHRNEVFIGDLDANTLTFVDRSDAGRTEDLAWSPDGEWLAYTYWISTRHSAIKLFDVAKQTSTIVTQPEFRDYSPSFDPDGRYLYFLSLRTFDPVYDSVQFELSFPRAGRPYLIALQAGGAAPFDPAPKGLTRREPGSESPEPHPVAIAPRVDLEGIAARIAAFPVPENLFGKIAGAADNKVVWSVLPIAGAHGRGGHKEVKGKLEVFDLETLRTEPLADEADTFELANDRTTLVFRAGNRLRAVVASGKPARGKDERGASPSDRPSRETGWIDLNRIRLSVDPRLEWRQMLREVWRLQRDHFWVSDMSGTDWNSVYSQYEPLLERVATRGELSDLIWEMQGELGTSHAYEMGGDHRRPPSVALGYLGAEFRFVQEDESYAITRIVNGDAWDAGADSPLNAVGVEAKVGERIVAVNGQRVSRERPPQVLLVHQAATKVELTLKTDSSGVVTSRTVLVATLSDEVPARYREWVECNRAFVHKQSDSRIGYFHLPDMMAAGFAEFHRYFGAECERDGLVVDVRYNRGGHVSQLLLEKVARRRIGYAMARWSQPSSYPNEAVAGPVVALTNEHSGSDGDIFSHGFKLMKIGPLVGTRTWGGVIGIWPRHMLVDGTQTTQPEFSFWFKDVGWGVENYGTDPDIEIDNAPQDAGAQRDRQLETAVETALDLIARDGASKPEFGARPVLGRPVFPPRRGNG